MSRNDPCWCGSGRKWKQCHWPNRNPVKTAAVTDVAAVARRHGIRLKTPAEIAGIRKASQVTALILDELCRAAKAGVTTRALDELAAELHRREGATAATLGYGDPPWPAHICTSVNEVICHGIPDDRPLRDGDIVNIDASAIVDGFFGDASRMVCIGSVSPERQRVVDASLESLERAIAVCRPGALIHEIGDCIEQVAAKHRCSVVYQFVGHGVGIKFHEPPEIPHHHNRSKIPLLPGMTFTIEPMINAGRPEAIVDATDGWTARTIDGKPSAQWEHTLLITEDGCEVLTQLRRPV
ncbi:MAG: methionyl aminopeptidase [Chlamydiia bacterium]